jgi:hypothetical protein
VPIVAIIQVVTGTEQETDIAEAEWPSHRQHGQLKLRVYELVHKESHDILPLQAPPPAFGSPLRRDSGLAEEEEEYAVVHGHQRVDGDGVVELEHALSRGKRKRTITQAQAEEAPAPKKGSREREKC